MTATEKEHHAQILQTGPGSLYMTSSIKKKFIDLVESMLDALIVEDDPSTEAMLKPLRSYIHDIEQFTTHKVVDSRFRAFVKTRDEQALEAAVTVGNAPPGPDLEKSQQAINHTLDQVLQLLEQGLTTSENWSLDLKEVMQKVYEAKTINNIRALSESFVTIGQKMMNKGEAFHSGLSDLAVELSFCKNQIQDLEGQLVENLRSQDHDQLTGLRSECLFLDDLAVAAERASRFHGSLCLLLMDIDRFREINRWGHQVGDDVLVNFGRLLNRSLRDFDLTYRLGGDKFGVIFSNCSLEKAYKVANRVREYISSHVYQAQDVEFTMTLSGGVTMLRANETPQMLFTRTQTILQKARESGGNRVSYEE